MTFPRWGNVLAPHPGCGSPLALSLAFFGLRLATGVRSGSACLPGKNCGIRRGWTIADLFRFSCKTVTCRLFFPPVKRKLGVMIAPGGHRLPPPFQRRSQIPQPKPRRRRSGRIGNSIVMSWLQGRSFPPFFTEHSQDM